MGRSIAIALNSHEILSALTYSETDFLSPYQECKIVRMGNNRLNRNRTCILHTRAQIPESTRYRQQKQLNWIRKIIIINWPIESRANSKPRSVRKKRGISSFKRGAKESETRVKYIQHDQRSISYNPFDFRFIILFGQLSWLARYSFIKFSVRLLCVSQSKGTYCWVSAIMLRSIGFDNQ